MESIINIEALRFLFFEKPNVEENVVKRAKAGDRDAFAQIYEQHVDSIYRFVFSRVSNEMVAEDLTAQVFLKAWEGIPRFRERGIAVRAWLFRIARNTIIDNYRTAKVELCLDLDAAHHPDPNGDVDKKLEAQLEEDQLAEAMNQLTEDQHQVLSLRFLAGLNTEEVARTMGKRAGAVRALQMRGLQALAKILEGKDGKFSKNS